ncbi:hypothetical protein BL254_17265 [Protofrankia sp. BMG5.30]|uniref:N-acetyltransferase domain-containing protein n=1 Tax=Protofrankia coriariae TaxID=1562887 RepID=A0ABR5F5E7_9ACTN|nr:hypothetical protein FrCorBMG51_08470 [Protofrankia coriariae]ONH34295.1 hypothetical protein BL254_17265 [Protofrankia sp. BMG5.30]
MDVPTIVTDRLVLRCIDAADLNRWVEIASKPEFYRYLSGPTDRASAWRNIALQLGHWVLRGYGLWAVDETATGSMVGRVGLWGEEDWPGVEAVWFLDPAVWGRGYATEAGAAAVRFAFEKVGTDEVISVIRPDNVRSVRVAERLGKTFQRTEHLHGADKSVYAITRGEWEARTDR